MAFLTKIKIKDTGKRRVSDATQNCTEIAPGDDGNPGSWLTLDVEEISMSLDVNTTNEPTLKFENDDQNEIFGISEADTSSIGVPKWNIRGVLDLTKASDLKTFAKLLKMAKTQGVKQITGAGTAETWLNYVNYYDDYYADQSKSTATTIDAINVRFANITVNAPVGTNKFRYTLDLVETS